MKTASMFLLAAMLCGTALAGGAERAPQPRAGAAPAPEAFDLVRMRAVIEARNRRFTQAHVEGDRAAIDAMFTDDARVLPPGADPVVGRAAIDALTAQYLAYGITEFTERTTHFYGNADLIVDQGDYVLVYGKDRTVERGKYLNVWTPVDGDWKLRSNIWNTNAPAPPGP